MPYQYLKDKKMIVWSETGQLVFTDIPAHNSVRIIELLETEEELGTEREMHIATLTRLVEAQERLATEHEAHTATLTRLVEAQDQLFRVIAKQNKLREDSDTLAHLLDIAKNVYGLESISDLFAEVDRLLAVNGKLVAALEESHALNVNWVSDAEPEMLAYYSEYKNVIAQATAAIKMAEAD